MAARERYGECDGRAGAWRRYFSRDGHPASPRRSESEAERAPTRSSPASNAYVSTRFKRTEKHSELQTQDTRSLTQDSSRRPFADASPLAALYSRAALSPLAVASYSGGSTRRLRFLPSQRRASTLGLPARVLGQAPSREWAHSITSSSSRPKAGSILRRAERHRCDRMIFGQIDREVGPVGK